VFFFSVHNLFKILPTIFLKFFLFLFLTHRYIYSLTFLLCCYPAYQSSLLTPYILLRNVPNYLYQLYKIYTSHLSSAISIYLPLPYYHILFSLMPLFHPLYLFHSDFLVIDTLVPSCCNPFISCIVSCISYFTLYFLSTNTLSFTIVSKSTPLLLNSLIAPKPHPLLL